MLTVQKVLAKKTIIMYIGDSLGINLSTVIGSFAGTKLAGAPGLGLSTASTAKADQGTAPIPVPVATKKDEPVISEPVKPADEFKPSVDVTDEDDDDSIDD